MASGLASFPADVTGFVGRKQELASLAAMLRTGRLVTVTGPGGVGKTRIALRTAAKVAAGFAAGACLVELAGLRDPELLPHTVATGLGLPEQDTRPQLDAILVYLRDRQLLLILDTCEHLVDACAMLVHTVLRAAPRVTVLCTSREPLDSDGEHIFPLLPLPEADAVELFAQRAAAVVPEFAVTTANRADVVRLCRWLDGIPLAIELATVRLRAVPLEQLALRLADRFRVLTGERRNSLRHHQTLRTAIQWSHDLCTPAQQLLWARLSVFAGSFDISAAEQVCGGDSLAAADVLPELIGLVDKSVVVFTADRRYRLLDTIREFGAERLADRGEASLVRERHVRRYLALAQDFGARATAEDQLDRYRDLRADHENIRAALGYAFDAAELDAEAADLVIDLYAYWQISGLLREGRYWIGKVLDRFSGPSPERARALVMTGFLAALQGEITEAIAVLDEGIPLAESLGQDLTGARGYGIRTLAYGFAGLVEQATLAGSVAVERFAAISDEAGQLALDVQLSLLHLHNGDLHRTIDQASHGLARLPEGSRERWMQGWLNFSAGVAQFLLGSLAESAATLRTALAMKHELGDMVGIASCLDVLGWVAGAWERYDRTAWLLGAADTLWERIGTRLMSDAAMEEIHQRAAKAATDDLGMARYTALFGRGARDTLDHAVALAVGDEDAVAIALAAPSGTPVAADAASAAAVAPAISGSTASTPDMPADPPAGTADPLAGTADPLAACRQNGSPTPSGLSVGTQLTSRQRQIATLVAAGLSNKDIAARLVISKRTVDAHIDHIFAKMSVSSRMQLATRLPRSTDPSRPAASPTDD